MRLPFPSVDPPSQGEMWRTAVRTAPICRERVPLEATLSYPVPGRGMLHFFHTIPSADHAGRRRVITRIAAQLPDLRIVEFHTSDGATLFPGLPLEVAAEPMRTDAPTEEALYRSYPALVRRYPTSPAGALGGQFVEALERLVPAALIPYYEALNPDFFAWCRRG